MNSFKIISITFIATIIFQGCNSDTKNIYLSEIKKQINTDTTIDEDYEQFDNYTQREINSIDIVTLINV